MKLEQKLVCKMLAAYTPPPFVPSGGPCSKGGQGLVRGLYFLAFVIKFKGRKPEWQAIH